MVEWGAGQKKKSEREGFTQNGKGGQNQGTYPEGPGGKTMLGNRMGAAEVNIANGKVGGWCRNGRCRLLASQWQ